MRDASLAPEGHIDENTAARLVQGLLSQDERSRVERHLDSCPACSALMTELVRIYLPGGPHTQRVVPVGDLPTLHSPGHQSTELVPGAEVGRYRVERLLGQGGMGVVYVAHDPTLGRKVALKLLRGHPGDGSRAEEARERLIREAHAMARLAAPNVVPVHDAGHWQGLPFIAMELVDGSTLRDWLRAEPRSSQAILRVFLEAGEGLAAAHAAALVHRDFKPDNVLVGRDGRARVTDFGLTRIDDTPQEPQTPYRTDAATDAESPGLVPLTRAGVVMGTPAYMAPEQLFGHRADAQSDQFSFAAALYEALFGTRPFPAKNLEELRWRVASGRIAEPVTNLGAPGWVRPVLERALSTDPAKRYPSMRALLDTLAGRADRAPRLHVQANVVLQAALLLLHLFIFGTYLVVLAGAAPPSSPSSVDSSFIDESIVLTVIGYALLFAFVWMLAWGPLGVVWVPLNLWGLARRRPWARYSTMVYALFSLPTCLATPYSLYALVSLNRPSVKRYFEAP